MCINLYVFTYKMEKDVRINSNAKHIADREK